MPSEQIWLDDEKLSQHFAMVKERYRRGSGSESVPDPGDLEQNELTKGLRG